MERSYPRARLLVAAVALIAASGVGFVATTALTDPGDPVDEVCQMDAETSARLSPEDRARHERMHEACHGLMTERREG